MSTFKNTPLERPPEYDLDQQVLDLKIQGLLRDTSENGRDRLFPAIEYRSPIDEVLAGNRENLMMKILEMMEIVTKIPCKLVEILGRNPLAMTSRSYLSCL